MNPTDFIASAKSPEWFSLSLPSISPLQPENPDGSTVQRNSETPRRSNAVSIILEDHEPHAATQIVDPSSRAKLQKSTATIRQSNSTHNDKSPHNNTLWSSGNYRKESDIRDSQQSSGALRSGRLPSLCTLEMIGLLAQYAAVGIVYGALPGMVYPLMQNYLNVDGVQTVAVRSLLAVPWSFKVFYGILTDCVPIFGYRRRPYIAIGWFICISMLFRMAWMPLGAPYYTDVSVRDVKPVDYTSAQTATLNPTAQALVGKYTAMMMLATFGYLLGDVAADALVVEYAQREPERTRGKTQSAVYTVRNVFMMLANVFTGFCLNGRDYGGDFDLSLSFPQVMLCLAITVTPVIPITFYCIPEHCMQKPVFSNYLANLWRVLQQGVVYQVIGYKFFASLFENFTSITLDPMQQYWAKATPMMEKVANIAAMALMAAVFSLTGKYGLQWNWRKTTCTTFIFMTIIDATSVMLTTWNIVRNQYFWLGMPVLETVPRGINFIVSMYVIVELVKIGQEGAIYGLLSTVSNLAEPFAKTISKNLNAPFMIDNSKLQNDSLEVRYAVTATHAMAYTARLFSLFFLQLLPAQKRETQELRGRRDLDSAGMGLLTICYLLGAFVYTMVANTLSIIPYTSCTILAGGAGCDS